MFASNCKIEEIKENQVTEVAPSGVEFHEKVLSKLNKIRIEEERGHCLSCACETAKVLMSTQSYIPKSINKTNAETYERSAIHDDEKIIKKSFKATKDKNEINLLMDYLNEAEPGSIFIADNEDHVYVLFKSYQNQIYLLDSDAKYYTQINEAKDFSVPIEDFYGYKDAPKSGYFYDYFLDNEGGKVKLTLLNKKADESWNEILKPLENPISTSRSACKM